MTLRPLSFAVISAFALLPLSYSAVAQVSKAELQSISIPDHGIYPVITP